MVNGTENNCNKNLLLLINDAQLSYHLKLGEITRIYLFCYRKSPVLLYTHVIHHPKEAISIENRFEVQFVPA